MPIHDPNGFEHRLWEAVTGGRPRWPDGKRSAFLLTYDMDADFVVGFRAGSTSRSPDRAASSRSISARPASSN